MILRLNMLIVLLICLGQFIGLFEEKDWKVYSRREGKIPTRRGRAREGKESKTWRGSEEDTVMIKIGKKHQTREKNKRESDGNKVVERMKESEEIY